MAVHRDYWRFITTAPPTDLKLKFNWEHFDIFTRGFDFGLDKLTSEELADCVDEICPCEQKHSPDYLKKLRARLKKASEQLVGERARMPEHQALAFKTPEKR